MYEAKNMNAMGRIIKVAFQMTLNRAIKQVIRFKTSKKMWNWNLVSWKISRRRKKAINGIMNKRFVQFSEAKDSQMDFDFSLVLDFFISGFVPFSPVASEKAPSSLGPENVP